MKRKFFLNSLLLSLLLFSCSDKDNENEEVKISSIKIENVYPDNTISIKKGTTLQLEVTSEPSVDAKALIYESGYTDVFSVDQNGMITALKEGKAALTVKSSNDFDVSATVTILVPDVPVESIDILDIAENETIELETTTKRQLNVKILPENATITKLNYKSSDESIFTVNQKGLILGISQGEAMLTIEATDGTSIKLDRKIKVNRSKVNYIGATDTYVLVGAQVDISKGLSFTPNTASLEGVIFTSSDISIGTVDSKGVVTGVGKGEVIITIKATDGSDVEGSCKVLVGAGFNAIDRTNFQVECSSQQESDGGGKYMILNDDRTKYWHSAWDNAPFPHWLLITMDEIKPVSKIKIDRRKRGDSDAPNTDTKFIEIEGSLDGIKYTLLGTMDFGNKENKVWDMSIEFYPQNLKYIKLTITESNRDGNHANIAVFQPYILD